MNGQMRKCEHQEEQEKCDQYVAKCDKPKKVDMTCLFYMKDFLGTDGGSICWAPPLTTNKEKG